MRSRELRVLKRGDELLEITPEIMAFLKEPRPLIIAKANIHARVHRRVYLDYIGVKRFDAAGNLTGEFRIVGLFTSTAYTRSAHGIPYLRRKIAAVERRAGFEPDSHSGKALANVLEHYPRDELFQVDEDTLYRFVARHPAARRAPARARAGAARPLRPLRLGAGLRAARALRQRYPRADRRLSGAGLSTAGSRPSIRSSRKARWCACISSSAAPAPPRPPVDQAKLEHDVARHRAHLERRAGRGAGARAIAPAKAHELFERYRDAFSRRLPRRLFAGNRRRRHPRHRGAQRAAPARRRFPSPAGAATAARSA